MAQITDLPVTNVLDDDDLLIIKQQGKDRRLSKRDLLGNLPTKADVTYVDSENLAQDAIISGKEDTGVAFSLVEEHETAITAHTKAQVGLSNVNNTSDMDKPVSSAVQAALDTKANSADVANLSEDETITGLYDFTQKPTVNGSPVLTEVDISGGLVIPHTGGGTLSAGEVNEIRDGDTGYLLPLANSVLDRSTITINFPQAYSVGNNPEVSRTGTDNIVGADGNDTMIRFLGSARITLTSDGVSDWRL